MKASFQVLANVQTPMVEQKKLFKDEMMKKSSKHDIPRLWPRGETDHEIYKMETSNRKQNINLSSSAWNYLSDKCFRSTDVGKHPHRWPG